MTLQDLIDEAKSNNTDPKKVIICDYQTLDQFEYFQTLQAKVGGNLVELMFISTEDMLLTEAVVLRTLSSLAANATD